MNFPPRFPDVPTVGDIFVFYARQNDLIEGTPCFAIPCPFCHAIHTLPVGSGEVVEAQCRSSDASSDRCPADFWTLIHAGPAPHQVMRMMQDGRGMENCLPLLDELQPKEVWGAVRTVSTDPTRTAEPTEISKSPGEALNEIPLARRQTVPLKRNG